METQDDKEPEAGDLIEIFRVHQHWAVYVGHGRIVHLVHPSEVAGASSSMSVVSVTALVKKEKLWDVVGTNEWRINNSLDEKYKPLPADDIVRNACALVGQELPYNLLRENCEHFANTLRYVIAESGQVRRAGQTVTEIAAAAYFGVGAVALLKQKGKQERKGIQVPGRRFRDT